MTREIEEDEFEGKLEYGSNASDVDGDIDDVELLPTI